MKDTLFVDTDWISRFRVEIKIPQSQNIFLGNINLLPYHIALATLLPRSIFLSFLLGITIKIVFALTINKIDYGQSKVLKC